MWINLHIIPLSYFKICLTCFTLDAGQTASIVQCLCHRFVDMCLFNSSCTFRATAVSLDFIQLLRKQTLNLSACVVCIKLSAAPLTLSYTVIQWNNCFNIICNQSSVWFPRIYQLIYWFINFLLIMVFNLVFIFQFVCYFGMALLDWISDVIYLTKMRLLFTD